MNKEDGTVARSTSKASLVLLCDRMGIVQEVVRNDVGLDEAAVVGRPFSLLVERSSFRKALDFLETLRIEAAVYDWELILSLSGKTRMLHFAGGVVDEMILVVGAEDRPDLLLIYDDLARIGNEQANQLRMLLKDQPAPKEERGAADEERVYDEISRLNNQLVQMQRELARKNAELERLNTLKNEFLGMAAHDLRNPLHQIHGYSELLQLSLADVAGEQDLQFLSIILNSSQFMVSLVNDLLDVAKIESGRLTLRREETDLAALVERNIALNEALAAKKQIGIHLQSEALPPTPVDADKIEQVLNNLLSNAVKFSQPGTTVAVRLSRRNDEVVLSVADEGPGIPADELDQLFRPFETTSVRGTAGEKSAGLGLVIVRKIVEEHGGRIDVESEVGEGTTFHVILPQTAVA
jgi:signal transduction histidine kinase